MKNLTNFEKTEITWELFEKLNYNVDATCKQCPFRNECHSENSDLCYGCGVWEELMGDDL